MNETESLFVCYSRCSTCAKARTWLNEHHIAFHERDIKGDNPTYEELRDWYQTSGLPLRRFFNTSGMLYRSLGLATKLPTMSDDEALHLLATDGMLVKRPIIVNAHNILVGFAPSAWSLAFSSTDDALQ